MPPIFPRYAGMPWSGWPAEFGAETKMQLSTDAAADHLEAAVLKLPQRDKRRAGALAAISNYRAQVARHPAAICYAAMAAAMSAIFTPPPAKPAPAGGRSVGPKPAAPQGRPPAAAIPAGGRRLTAAETRALVTRLNGSRGRLAAAYLPAAKP